MSDPTSKAAVQAFKRLGAAERAGHAPYASSRDIAIVWLLVEQLNVLRAQHSLPAITMGQARDEIMRLTDLIDGLADGT